MKRFSKILVILLSLAAIITAFTVVALAEDAGPADRTPVGYGDFDGSALFDYATSSSTGRLSYDRDAWATVHLQDNGNKYVVVGAAPDGYKDTLKTTDGSYTQWANSQWDVNQPNDSKYNIVDYPYFLFELDITTLDGSYSGFTCTPRSYGASKNMQLTTVNFSNLGLSTQAYDWNHVSIIYVYVGEGKFNFYYYVDGVYHSSGVSDFSSHDLYKVDGATEAGLKKILLRQVKFGLDPGNDIRLDNMYSTCFPAGYLEGEEDVITKIANYRFNYGEGYTFPYKQTVATVKDNATGEVTYFDNYEDAYAAKNENNTFKSVYAAEIIDAKGNVTYVNEADIESVFSTAAAGSTIKLHQDFFATKNAVSGGAFQVKKNLTLDLNGYNFGNIHTTTTQYAATLGEDGSYVKGDATGVTRTAGTSGYIFYQQHNGFEFTITSSRPGATVSSLGINEEEWVCDGKVVNKVVTKYWGQGLFSFYPSNSAYNILGENITFYCQTVAYAEHGSNNAKLKVNIDGGTYYIFRNDADKVGEGVLALRRGGNHTVSNATFFANTHPIIKSSWDQNTTTTFNNCTIYDSSVHGEGITNVHYFNNCRLVNTLISNGSTASTYLGENTYVTAQNGFDAAKGLIIVPDNSVTYSYRPVSSLKYTYDEASGEFVPSFVFHEAQTGTFSYTTDNVTKYEDVLIDDANISMLFTNNFDMMFYLPVKAEQEYTRVTHFTKQNDTVFIEGKEYYAYKRALTTVNASFTAPISVTFTKDGVTYTQTFHTDALLYAKLVLTGETVDVEAKAIANMVRFIKEARTLAGLSVSDRFAEIEALYTLDGYKADTEYDALGVDYSGLTGVGMTFAVNGLNASYMVDIPVATFANADKAKVTITFEDGTVAKLAKLARNYATNGYYTYTTTNMHISEMLAQTVSVTVTIPTTDGDTVLTGTYSVGAYVQATGNTMAKAMFEFGAAAKAYREYLEENT